MLAEQYLRRRFREGKEQGLAEGKERGLEEGRKEGFKEGVKVGKKVRDAKIERVRAWNERRLEARAQGEPFDEPFPDLDDDHENSGV